MYDSQQGKWSYRQRKRQFGHANGGPVRRLTVQEIAKLALIPPRHGKLVKRPC